MMGDIQQFDYSVRLLRALLWQYEGATNLQGLVQRKQDWYTSNQEEFWQNWYDNVFNLDTANQFGLIVWSIILGFPVYVNASPYTDQPTFGFNGSGGTNFDNGNFNDSSGSSYFLSIETQRIALKLRYFQLTGSGTVPEINRTLKYVFSDMGTSYVLDYQNMNQAIIFLFPVTFDLQYLFNNFDILPRPAGVKSSYIDGTIQYFGFAGSGGTNFDNGIFGG